MAKAFKEHEQLVMAKIAELVALFREAEKDGYTMNFGVQLANGQMAWNLGLGVLPPKVDPNAAR